MNAPDPDPELLAELAQRRMCSVGNLSLKLKRSVSWLRPRLEALVRKGLIRVVERTCADGCASCAGCGREIPYSSTIVISKITGDPSHVGISCQDLHPPRCE